ncbi:MAG: outer membrane beta-barrel protein [Spirochaetota bacterium]
MLNNKLFLLVVLFSFISMPLIAREGNSQLNGNLYLGASGADFTSWSGSTLGIVLDGDPTLWRDPSSDPGGAGGIGVVYRYFVNDNVALNTGLAAIYKSFSINYPAYTAIDDITFDFGTTYLIIPVGIRLYFEYFFLGAGAYYGMVGDTEVEITYTTIYGTATEKETIDFDDDFGLYIDLGLDIPLSDQFSLELGMRYECGLSTVYKDEDAIITDVKTRALLFNIGLCVII